MAKIKAPPFSYLSIPLEDALHIADVAKGIEPDDLWQEYMNLPTEPVKPLVLSGYPIRVMGTFEEPLFVAADVCQALGLDQVSRALSRLDPDEYMLVPGNAPVLNQHGHASIKEVEVNVVTESGLYNLAFTSNKEEAKRFRRWVTSEVLPALRKYGVYETPAYKQMKAKAEAFENILPYTASLGDQVQYLMGKTASKLQESALRSLAQGYRAKAEAYVQLASEQFDGGWPEWMSKGERRCRLAFIVKMNTEALRILREVEAYIAKLEHGGGRQLQEAVADLQAILSFTKEWVKIDPRPKDNPIIPFDKV